MSRMASGSKLELERAIATIKGVPGSKPTWLSIAKSVDHVRRGGHWREAYASPTAWLDFAAEITDLDTNTIRRYIAAYEFLERKRHSNPSIARLINEADSRKISMAAVELIKRMDEKSPAEADQALAAHIKGGLSVRKAHKLYLMVGNPPYLAKSDSAKSDAPGKEEFSPELIKRFAQEATKLSGRHGRLVMSQPGKVLSYVSPDGILVGEDNSGKFIDGWERRRLKDPINRSHLISALSEITYSASFFRHYWVVVAGSRRSAETLAVRLADVQVQNVGISVLAGGSLEQISVPTAGPVPDRQALALAELSGVRA